MQQRYRAELKDATKLIHWSLQDITDRITDTNSETIRRESWLVDKVEYKDDQDKLQEQIKELQEQMKKTTLQEIQKAQGEATAHIWELGKKISTTLQRSQDKEEKREKERMEHLKKLNLAMKENTAHCMNLEIRVTEMTEQNKMLNDKLTTVDVKHERIQKVCYKQLTDKMDMMEKQLQEQQQELKVMEHEMQKHKNKLVTMEEKMEEKFMLCF